MLNVYLNVKVHIIYYHIITNALKSIFDYDNWQGLPFRNFEEQTHYDTLIVCANTIVAMTKP